ncbi:MAG: hypothetical protein ACR2NR_20915 [Solirubrobacteraceae bacterium]
MAGAFAGGVVLRVVFMLEYRPGFLGISDAGSYIYAAHFGLFSNVYDPAGYPLFVRVLHTIDPHLSLLILVQHGLGVATAALWYQSVRRVTGSTVLGLIPAVLVLFDGYSLWVEHTPITDTLFTFLVAALSYLAVAAAEGRLWPLAGVGLLIGVCTTVRPIGFILVLVVGAWILWVYPGPGRHRLAAAITLALPALVVVAGYVVIQRADTGFTGLTQDSGRVIYARAARFADCHRFTPPAGTAELCERTPEDKRGSANQYLNGTPDRDLAHLAVHEGQITATTRSISPAWRVFGPPPGGNGKLLEFGLDAIVHQPLDYLSAIAGDFHDYWADDHRAFIAAAASVEPPVDQLVAGYYRTGAGVSSSGLGFLRSYGETIEVTGVLMVMLLLVPVLGLFSGDRRARRAAALFACTGWILPLAADAIATVDPRYMLPAYGPLAAAGAVGLGSPQLRRAVKRLAAPGRPRAARRA